MGERRGGVNRQNSRQQGLARVRLFQKKGQGKRAEGMLESSNEMKEGKGGQGRGGGGLKITRKPEPRKTGTEGR